MQLTLAAGAVGSITAANAFGDESVNGGLRKTLIFAAESGTTDVRYAWRPDVASSGALRGIPLAASSPVIIACDDLRLTKTLYFISAAGGEVTWEAQYV